MLSTLDDTFNEAVGQLLQWGGVFMGEDATYVIPNLSFHYPTLTLLLVVSGS